MNKILVHGTSWMYPENIMLSEKNPDTKEHILYDSIYMKCPEQANPKRQKADQWVLRVEGKPGTMSANRYGVSFWNDGVLEFDSDDGCTTL